MESDAVNGPFRRILLDHALRYPAWQIQDLYKLIHQASRGSGHAVEDYGQALRWLETELAHLPVGPGEPLIDPISADGAIVRVHLPALLARGFSPRLLLDAFVQTSSAFHGSIQLLEEQWQEAAALSTQGRLAFDPAELNSFILDIRAQGYPAVHHSVRYSHLYQPAYRVVARFALPPEWNS